MEKLKKRAELCNGDIVIREGNFEATIGKLNPYQDNPTNRKLTVREAGYWSCGHFVFDVSAASLIAASLKSPVSYKAFIAAVIKELDGLIEH